MPGEAMSDQEEVRDEYGDAFEEAIQEKTPEQLEAEALEKERAEKEEVDGPDKQPEGQTDGKGAVAAGEEPDYKKLYEEEHQKYSSLQGMYNKSQEENEQLKTTSKPAKEEPKADGEGDEVSAEDLLKTLALEDDEDVKFMLEEYDSLARPVQKIVAKAIARMKPGKQTNPEDLAKQVQDIVGREIHNTTIRSAHGDFDDLVKSGELKTYVETLPEGEDKTRLTGYYNQGTTSQVISLIDSYKESKGTPGQRANEKDSKIRNLTAVPKRHTPVNVSRSTGKAENYADAFDEAVAASGKR